MSKVLPILFNTDMVQAILDERKTVTRRILKIQPWDNGDGCNHELKNIFKDEPREFCCRICGLGVGPSGHSLFKSPYQLGDILYVRETFYEFPIGTYHYRADFGTERDKKFYEAVTDAKWRPSIHMPKEAARIWLKVTGVRVERIQDIDDDGVVAEGLQIGDPFDELWDSTIKKSDLDCYGWDANPWVWVIEFERCEKPEENDNTKEIADFLNERENGI